MTTLASNGHDLTKSCFSHPFLQLGIGLLWSTFGLVNDFGLDGCTYKADTEAAKVFQDITSCPATQTVELEDSVYADISVSKCGHWSNECFNEKLLMNANPGGAAKFSKITLASLKDMGYEINDRETDDITDPDIAESCKCNGASQTAFEQSTYKIPLSEEATAAAVATGLAKLSKYQVNAAQFSADAAQNSAAESSSDAVFLGDKRIMVLMLERGVLHGVLVEAP